MTQTQQPIEQVDLSAWETQTRQVTWASPFQGDLEALLALDGVGQLKAIEEGLAPPPPVMHTIDVCGFEAERGTVTVSMRPQSFHYNPMGVVHGGMIATLLDTAAACAVQSTLAVGESSTSLDLNVKFLRSVTIETGVVHAVGTVTNRGRRTALAQVELRDDKDRLLAHATSSCMIFTADL